MNETVTFVSEQTGSILEYIEHFPLVRVKQVELNSS